MYDAEAIQATRETLRLQVEGREAPAADGPLVARELRDVAAMDGVMTVSALERVKLAASGRSVHVVSHVVRPTPGPEGFARREGFLFVGAFGPQSPNADSVSWFCREVRPLLEERIGPISLTVAGHDPTEEILALAAERVRILGDVVDLAPLYDAARVVIAPTRFAAGIPLKVLHAAGHGVPVVCTRLLAGQLGWQEGRDLLAADTAAEFAESCAALHTNEALWRHLRREALARVSTDYGCDGFADGISTCLEEALAVVRAPPGDRAMTPVEAAAPAVSRAAAPAGSRSQTRALAGLVWTLVRTDFKARYHGTLSGFVWALLKPTRDVRRARVGVLGHLRRRSELPIEPHHRPVPLGLLRRGHEDRHDRAPRARLPAHQGEVSVVDPGRHVALERARSPSVSSRASS